MSPYKKKKLVGIAINVAIIAICVVLNQMETLGLLPVLVMAGCSLAILANGLYYFANYDEEEKSISDTFDVTGMTLGKSLTDGLSSKDKS